MRKIGGFLLVGLGLVIGAWLVTFTIYNRDLVVVDFFPADLVELPIAAIAALGFIAGVALSVIGTTVLQIRALKSKRQLQGQLKALGTEVNELRNAPLRQGPVGATEKDHS